MCAAPSSIDCQSFREGCVGCCINTRWSPRRQTRYLSQNTDALQPWLDQHRRPSRRDITHLHRSRGGLYDHLLMFWLVLPTLGLSIWVWRRWFGGCAFAGFLSRSPTRVGCLLHPAHWGQDCADIRRWAFPWVPTLFCNRTFECPGLRAPSPVLECSYIEAGTRNAATFQQNTGRPRAKKMAKKENQSS